MVKCLQLAYAREVSFLCPNLFARLHYLVNFAVPLYCRTDYMP